MTRKTNTDGLTFIIDHQCARFAAVMNACVKAEREGLVWCDLESRVHMTKDEATVRKMRSLGAKVYPA